VQFFYFAGFAPANDLPYRAAASHANILFIKAAISNAGR
jgi:hypothetical protein